MVRGGDGLAALKVVDGAPDQDPSEGAVEDEVADIGLPGVGQDVEALVQAALGMGLQLRGALCGGRVGATSLAGGAALRPLGGTATRVALVDVSDHGSEVAIADARLAPARVRAEPALGVVEILERVAAKRADERVGRAEHRILGVDGLEEQARGAILGAGVVALLLDDRAEHVGILASERMAEVAASGGVHAQERRDEQRRDMARELGRRSDGTAPAT
jgi:hypothetical protein